MKKNSNGSKKFHYRTSQNLPELLKVPSTEWDMAGLYYKSVTDPQIEKDISTTEQQYKTFVRKYKTSDFTSNPTTLRTALDALYKIEEKLATNRPSRYLRLLASLDSNNDAVTKRLNLVEQRQTKIENTILFFRLDLAKTSTENQKKLLNAPILNEFKYYLTSVFTYAEHHLTEAEEKVLRLLGDCSFSMWTAATEKMLGRKFITYKGKTIPVNEAFDRLNTVSFAEQPKLWKLIMTEIGTLDEVVENELTAICTRVQISDELRGYKKSYSASVLNKEDDEKSVEALIAAVSSTGFDLSKKFYKLKAKLHGVEKLHYAQRNASLGTAPNIGWTQATDICRDVFYGVNTSYGRIFDEILTNGQIDVYPKKGKRSGAFVSAEIAQPTQVFLNQVDTMGSLQTYAHEMGHAIHSERAKEQPPQYESYSLTTAETASTLFEGLLFDAVMAQATESNKITLLHDKIMRDVSTIQRQIAFHNFELEMYTTVKEFGAVTRNDLNNMMQKHLRSYCGEAITINELDGHSYIYVGHFRYNFYVYTYVFGTLMSTIMAEKFSADNSYATEIDTFLTAGGCANVCDIFKSIGLNTKKIETFNYGLNKMEDEIKLLEKLTK